MRASDLSYDQKKALINFIKERIGSDYYDRIVREVGNEDAAIDAIVEAMSKSSGVSSSSSSNSDDSLSPGAKFGIGIAVIGGLGLLCLIGYGLYKLFAYTGGGVVSWIKWLSGHF